MASKLYLGETHSELVKKFNELVDECAQKVNLTGAETISGLKTFSAPTNVSGSETTTMKLMTSNGGSVRFGKEGPNSGSMIRLDQVDGTCRLRFRASATAGAMVWEQPEQGAQLYMDLGKKGADYRRISFPSSGGTLALVSQITSECSKKLDKTEFNSYKESHSSEYQELNNKISTFLGTNTETLSGIKDLIAAAEESDEISALTTALGNKANSNEVLKLSGGTMTGSLKIQQGQAINVSQYNDADGVSLMNNGGGTATQFGSSARPARMFSSVQPEWYKNGASQGVLAIKSDIPTALKNPKALTFGSKTYDGSSAQTITASDIGAELSGAASNALASAKSYADTAIANLVNSAPETLNTLGELATAIQAHEDEYDALLKTVGSKVKKTTQTATVIGTSKTTEAIGEYQLVFPKGAVFSGTAASAGLVTRGICGVTTPEANGSCSKENLYINYDGNNNYNAGRQLVLQAGQVGTHYGNNVYQYCAVRGDALKAYCDATYLKPSGVTVTQTLTSGKEIGSVKVGSTTTKLYAPEGATGSNDEFVHIKVSSVNNYGVSGKKYIYVQVISGELRQGDLIQVCHPKKTKKYNLENGIKTNERKVNRMKAFKTYTVNGVPDCVNAGVSMYKIEIDTNQGIGKVARGIISSFTRDGKQRKPRTVRVMRPYVDANGFTRNKQISNSVNIATSMDEFISVM